MAAIIERSRLRHALAPFNKPTADIVLRSSDGTDFRVHSVIVAEASEVFAGMFASQWPSRGAAVDGSTDHVGNTPVIQLAEDAKTIDALLRLCYPVADPAVDDTQQLRKVLAAAIKYAMEEAVALMRTHLRALIRMIPLEGWMVACDLKLEEDARRAVFTLSTAARPFDNNATLLRTISAGQSFRLRRCMASGCNVVIGSSFSFADVDHSDAAYWPRESLAHSRLSLQERPFADVICRASDGSEFLSHKAVLAAASLVMRDRLLALVAERPGPDTQTPSTAAGAQSLPVLDFPDMTGTTLSVLLELCYPVSRETYTLPFLLGPIPRLCTLVSAAEKHAIGRVSDMLQRALFARIPGAPLTTYLLASHLELGETYIRSAEEHVLSKGRPPSAYGWFPELESVNALAYHSLMVKHEDLERSGLSEHATCGPTAPCKRRRPGGF